MIERNNYGITHLCESGKGKFISGAADFGAAAQLGAVMAFISDRDSVSREPVDTYARIGF